MSANQAGVDDDASTTTPDQGEDNVGTQPKTDSILGTQDDLLSLARGMGHIIGEPLRLTPESSEPEETEAEVEEHDAEVESEEELPPTAEAEGEEEDEPESDKKKKDDWPASAKARVAEETEKRKARTLERDKAVEVAMQWKQRAEQAEAQLQETSAAPQNGADPLSTVFSPQVLERKKDEAEFYIAWSERNRNGGECPVYGKKDRDGNPVTEYLDEEGVTNLKLGCQKVLLDGIPSRRAYLGKYQEFNQIAVEAYPELKDSSSPFYREATEILGAIQKGFIPPDVIMWIAHALKGRNEYVQSRNGSGKKADATKKIVTSARTKVAPTATKTRGFVPSRGRVDLEKAEQTLKEQGDADAAEKWLEARGIGGGAKSKQVELVEK